MISVADIMVGDYLQNTNGNIGKVIGIQPYNQAPSEIIMSYNGGTCFSDPKMLQPIPITPEILEKNGFKKVGSYFIKEESYFIIEDDYYDVSIREITDSIWRVRYCNTEFPVFDGVLHIAFIHELQHAFRLFGIEKEIVL